MKYLLAFFLLAALPLVSEEQVTEPTTQTAFPKKASFTYGDKTYYLKELGTAVRKKAFIKVYAVASYIQEEVQGPVTEVKMMNDPVAKQLTTIWLRGVNAQDMVKGSLKSIRKALSEDEFAQLEGVIEEYLKLIDEDIQKGDEIIFRWIPEGVIQVIKNDKLIGQVDNTQFAVSFWSLWFGDRSVVDREKLLGLE